MSMYDVKPDSFPAVSEEMNKRAQRAMYATWETIAYDCFECSGAKSMPRSHVVEIVCDANYMEAYGGDNEAAKYCIWLSRYHKSKFQTICKETFGSREYA